MDWANKIWGYPKHTKINSIQYLTKNLKIEQYKEL